MSTDASTRVRADAGTHMRPEPTSQAWPDAAPDEFRRAIDAIPGLVWSALPDGYVDFLNQRWLEYTGLAFAQATGWGWQAAICPEDLPGLVARWRDILASGAPGEAIARLRRHDGVDRWFIFRAVPHHDATGAVVKWYGQTMDIEERRRAETLLAGEKQMLEMIAERRPLPDILAALCRLAESTLGDYLVSIPLVDAKRERLLRATAPSLPGAFSDALDGAAVGPDVGPCGTAVFNSEPILVADIAAEARWHGYRALAAEHGLRACWTTPILSRQGRVLGTCAVYSRRPGLPTARQQEHVEQVVNVARVAIERAQADETLRRSERYLVEAQRLSVTGSFSWRVATGEITWSDETYRIYELDRALAPTMGIARERVHPRDVALFDRTAANAVAAGADLGFAHRLRMPDGRVKHLQVVATAVRDESGQLVEYVGAVRDTTDGVRAERALRRARMRALEGRYAAMMEERTRLAREIHDTLLQGFNGVALMLLAASRKVEGPPDAVQALQHVLDLAQATLGDARRAVWDLRAPPRGSDFAATLRAALEDATRGAGLLLDFDVRGRPRPLDPQAEGAVFRVAQEAIANVIKHAGARRVRVRLTYRARGARLTVRDDGRGFAVDPDFRAYGGHWGLLGMWERASQVGARLVVRSMPGAGTRIALVLP